jgi:hypothetical protein
VRLSLTDQRFDLSRVVQKRATARRLPADWTWKDAREQGSDRDVEPVSDLLPGHELASKNLAGEQRGKRSRGTGVGNI